MQRRKSLLPQLKTTPQGHLSSRPSCLVLSVAVIVLLWLYHSSASPSSPSCFPHSTQLLISKALPNKLPACKYPSICFPVKPTCNSWYQEHSKKLDSKTEFWNWIDLSLEWETPEVERAWVGGRLCPPFPTPPPQWPPRNDVPWKKHACD